MNLKSIKLNNFKNFKGEYSYNFTPLTLIRGENGTGKSALCKDSLLFLLYGYYGQPLAQLPNKSLSDKKCSVTGVFDMDNHTYEISRTYPTNITIKKDGQELQLAKAEYQEFINSLFKTREHFKRFRLLDIQEGDNLLEQGDTTLKKILFSLDQEALNDIRRNLLDLKSKKELYNRDKITATTHFPSTIRLRVLKDGISILASLLRDYHTNNINPLKRNVESLISTETQFKCQSQQAQKYSSWLRQKNSCPICKQPLLDDYKSSLLQSFLEDSNNADIGADETRIKIDGIKADLSKHENHLNSIYDKQLRIKELIGKLELRLSQKEFVYNSHDVAVVKKAIDELDNFYSFYLKETINILEPLINNVIAKLGYSVSFQVSDKGTFHFELTKDGLVYTYKDLSTGQRLLLTIAFQLAIMLDKQEFGLIVADEGFSSLDEENLKFVFDLFQDTNFQLICVVHRLTNIPMGISIIDLEKNGTKS